MNIWHDVDQTRITIEDFLVVIEISKGSKKKYELDKETGLIILDRIYIHLHTTLQIMDLFQEHMRKTMTH